MLISIVLGVLVLDTVLRCILFKEIGIKWWKGLIPLYNRYELGKTVEDKSLGHNKIFLKCDSCTINRCVV